MKTFRDWLAARAAKHGLAGFPNPNQILVNEAAETLVVYDEIAGRHAGENPGIGSGLTDQGNVPMLIACLLHLCDAKGWNIADVLKRARDTYSGEVRHAKDTVREYLDGTNARPEIVTPPPSIYTELLRGTGLLATDETPFCRRTDNETPEPVPTNHG